MVLMKKGIELQFNWIFVLVTGAIILAFFFGVAQKQRSLSEQKLSVALASQMDMIYSAAIVSKGTTQPLAVPKTGMAFSCSKACECNFAIGRKVTEFGDKLLFAPAFLSAPEAWASAVVWKLPFRAANFLLLSNPKIKYYLVYDAGIPDSIAVFNKISKIMPKEFNTLPLSSLGAVGQLVPRGEEHVRLVFLGVEPLNPASLGLSSAFSDKSVSGVFIDADLRQAVFYEKTDPDELSFDAFPSLIAGDVLALGSIIAADHLMYDCVMKRAFGKLGIVAGVHAKRAKALEEAMSAAGRHECVYVTQHLDSVARAAGQLSLELSETVRDSILGVQTELERQNINLLKQGCPELY